ncbi:antibiotic biosynthesis monooxygenase [Lentibacter algarum]|uniref:putative quinol monooxygenase n=1 Tax=Lentibacter algarum TaxID=576131 RepID=UPI001C065E09|nr:putative quinol monooxygenase [Lentibacter algarum]MBU2980189.1 antibiotic biosynthesis monooxygenase [Lentibacter algarum]
MMTSDGTQVVHTAHLTCTNDSLVAFRDRLLRHATISQQNEPGCLCFRVHQDVEVKTRFFLLEIYADDAALTAHRESEHYLAFRRDTADQVADRKWWFWTAKN